MCNFVCKSTKNKSSANLAPRKPMHLCNTSYIQIIQGCPKRAGVGTLCPPKERRLTGHVITNFQLFLAVVLLLSKAALAGHKIGQNE